MRLLTFNIDNKIIEKIKARISCICDKTNDIEDTIYHSEVRYYNLILVKETNYFDCKKILENINSQITAVIFIIQNLNNELEIKLLKLGAILVMEETSNDDLILARIQSIYPISFFNEITFNDEYKIDFLNNSIKNSNNIELLLKGKSFEVLSYLIKNRHRPPISKEELLNVIWEEPELIAENVLEVNINKIRSASRKTFNSDFISTIRHRGYEIKDKEKYEF